jgi:hypothetical protein
MGKTTDADPIMRLAVAMERIADRLDSLTVTDAGGQPRLRTLSSIINLHEIRMDSAALNSLFPNSSRSCDLNSVAAPDYNGA